MKRLTWITMTSQWASWSLKSPATWRFFSTVFRKTPKESIKAPRYRPFVRGFQRLPVDSPHKGSVAGKAFPWHGVMTKYDYGVCILSPPAPHVKIVWFTRWMIKNILHAVSPLSWYDNICTYSVQCRPIESVLLQFCTYICENIRITMYRIAVFDFSVIQIREQPDNIGAKISVFF